MDTDINHIIQESLNGNKNYQEILLKKLHPLIYKSIYSYYDAKDSITEDLAQEGYIIILQCLKNYDKGRNVHFLRYVKTKLNFFYKNYYRNTKKQRETKSLNQKIEDSDANIEIENIIAVKNISPEDEIAYRDEIDGINANITKLSKKEQDVINLFYYEELNMYEIAKKLNIAYRTAIGRKYTALKKLRKIYKLSGGENDE